METAKHQAREAQSEIRALKARLARSLGEEIASEHPEHSVSHGDRPGPPRPNRANCSAGKTSSAANYATPRKSSKRRDV